MQLSFCPVRGLNVSPILFDTGSRYRYCSKRDWVLISSFKFIAYAGSDFMIIAFMSLFAISNRLITMRLLHFIFTFKVYIDKK